MHLQNENQLNVNSTRGYNPDIFKNEGVSRVHLSSTSVDLVSMLYLCIRCLSNSCDQKWCSEFDQVVPHLRNVIYKNSVVHNITKRNY